MDEKILLTIIKNDYGDACLCDTCPYTRVEGDVIEPCKEYDLVGFSKEETKKLLKKELKGILDGRERN